MILALALWVVLPIGVKSEDTLHIINFWDVDVYVQEVNTIDSSVVANTERTGNLYIDRIARTDTSTAWFCWEYAESVEPFDTLTMCMGFPVDHDIVVINHKPDVNGSGVVDISDLVWLIDYMFAQE